MIQFKYYNEGATFDASSLNNDDIAFVEDENAVYTHGKKYLFTEDGLSLKFVNLDDINSDLIEASDNETIFYPEPGCYYNTGSLFVGGYITLPDNGSFAIRISTYGVDNPTITINPSVNEADFSMTYLNRNISSIETDKEYKLIFTYYGRISMSESASIPKWECEIQEVFPE